MSLFVPPHAFPFRPFVPSPTIKFRHLQSLPAPRFPLFFLCRRHFYATYTTFRFRYRTISAFPLFRNIALTLSSFAAAAHKKMVRFGIQITPADFLIWIFLCFLSAFCPPFPFRAPHSPLNIWFCHFLAVLSTVFSDLPRFLPHFIEFCGYFACKKWKFYVKDYPFFRFSAVCLPP